MRRIAAAVLLAAAPLAAQTATVPEVFAGVLAGSGSYFPFARTRGRIQTWYAGLWVPRGIKTIREVGWRQDRWTKTGATTHRVEIVLDNNKLSFAQLGAVFAKNLSAPVTFFSLKTVSLPALNPPLDPGRPAAWIKGDRPFVYTGPNLLVQVTIRTKTTYATVPGLGFDAYFMGRQPFHFSSHQSCGGALKGSDAGPYWVLDLTGAPPKSAVLFLVGVRPLPLDLGGLFGVGCHAVVEPVLAVGLQADATGAARLQIPYAPAPLGLAALAQVLHPARTSSGFATTNAAHAILSGQGVSTHLYNWSRDGSIADTGPFATNRGTVLLVR